ncbi:response regulator receiver protein [Pseudomonas fragi]|uniref:Response regulator receiver protein n=1 Tax=Pseudomonas fragi TaxID=296 RepID=A0A266LQY7_PSEFR|nr:winged helix-turn-helix domain-containing protein [Pseudomonas fragi]OZY40476.1 response regulator receiver protein [Pseudomonas fragi]
MLAAGCNTDIQAPKALNFVHSKALAEDIEQLITSDVRHLDASNTLANLTCDFSHTEAVFIEVNTPEAINDSLELLKHIRLTNQAACIFILVTHNKSFTSINYYLAGADHCIKFPVDPLEKKALLSRTVEESHWRTNTRLTLDRTRLLLCSASQKIEISYTEMIIIDALIQAPQHVLSQDSIAKTLDPNIVFYDPRALEKTISRLRTKIKKAYNLELIFSVRAFGYRLRRGTITQ